MAKSQHKEFVRALAQRLPGARVAKRNTVVFPIQGDLLFGFLLEHTSVKNQAYLWKLCLPLCVPHPNVNLTFSDRLDRLQGSVDLAQEGLVENVLSQPDVKRWCEVHGTGAGDWPQLFVEHRIQGAFRRPWIRMTAGVMFYLEGDQARGLKCIEIAAEEIPPTNPHMAYQAQMCSQLLAQHAAGTMRQFADEAKVLNLKELFGLDVPPRLDSGGVSALSREFS
ncbi:hypothetical protein ACNI65_00910 [Roseateles sp. So40a]|uniref:hypothetical protein n=1 Tax=Roseateles sp. So40a TaxID=3400226 RepID=UPI003A8772E7